MDRITSKYYVVDNKLFISDNVNFEFNDSEYETYEVMRCSSGVLIFMSDHIDRMIGGIKNLSKEVKFRKKSAIENLLLLLENIKAYEGNVKLLGRVVEGILKFAAYGVAHSYPSAEMYKNGIIIKTIPVERPNPLIKQVAIANSITEVVRQNQNIDVYELLLVDRKNCVTEGSKSNFFLIRNNCLYSAPEDKILHGITRRHVLNIADNKGIRVVHQEIVRDDLKKYEAAFICGTSPKILPVRQVNRIIYNPDHPVIELLIKSYNDILDKHIEHEKNVLNNLK